MLTIIMSFILGFLAGLFVIRMQLAIMILRVENQSKQVERMQKDVRKQLEEAKNLVVIRKEIQKIITKNDEEQGD